VVEGAGWQRPSGVLGLAEPTQRRWDRVDPAEQTPSSHPLSIQRPSGLSVPVAIGFGVGADQAGGDQAEHSLGELGLGRVWRGAK
jgi:hypothetical protein